MKPFIDGSLFMRTLPYTYCNIVDCYSTFTLQTQQHFYLERALNIFFTNPLKAYKCFKRTRQSRYNGFDHYRGSTIVKIMLSFFYDNHRYMISFDKCEFFSHFVASIFDRSTKVHAKFYFFQYDAQRFRCSCSLQKKKLLHTYGITRFLGHLLKRGRPVQNWRRTVEEEVRTVDKILSQVTVLPQNRIQGTRGSFWPLAPPREQPSSS